MAVVKYRDKAGNVKILKQVKVNSVSEGWKPQEDWWDIDRILAEDTEDYEGKMICLLTDNFSELKVCPHQNIKKIKFSDGAEVYRDGNNITSFSHTWDVTKDKECRLGYKTRYVIFYSDRNVNCATNDWYGLRNTLYFIGANLNIMSGAGQAAYQFNRFRFCECMKLLSCVWEYERFYCSINSLKKVQLDGSMFPNLTSFETVLPLLNEIDSKILLEKMFNENLVSISYRASQEYNLRELNFENAPNIQNFSNACRVPRIINNSWFEFVECNKCFWFLIELL